MTTLREIQLTELEMLRYLDQLCRANGLKYSLIGGSMLGAVRHKGFIPWDDDIDVYMPTRDCRKLQKLVNNPDYLLQAPESDLCMPFIMFKLRKNKTLMVEPGTENLQIHQGVWLDIFPYCNAAKSNFMKNVQLKLRMLLQTYRCRYRYVKKPNRRFFHFLLTQLPRKVQIWIDQTVFKVIEWLGSEKSDEIFAYDVGKYAFYKKSYFQFLKEYDFEGMKAMGIQDYDDYLSYIYGKDYMTPRRWTHIENYDGVEL